MRVYHLLPLLFAACGSGPGRSPQPVVAAASPPAYFENCLLNRQGDTLFDFRYELGSLRYRYQCHPRLRFDFAFTSAFSEGRETSYEVLYGGPARLPRDTVAACLPGTAFRFRNYHIEAGKARLQYSFARADGRQEPGRYLGLDKGKEQASGILAILTAAARAGGLPEKGLHFYTQVVSGDQRYESAVPGPR